MAAIQITRGGHVLHAQKRQGNKRCVQNRLSVRAAAMSEQELGVKLPATHISASQNALKQIEASNAQGINSTSFD